MTAAGPRAPARPLPAPPMLEPRRASPLRLAGFVALLAVVALGLAVFSAFPWEASPPGAALLKVAFKHVAAFEREGSGGPSREELEKLPAHMRPQSAERARTGRRRDTVLRVALDGREALERTYRPGGLRRDGPTFAYEELAVAAGRHHLLVTLADRGGEASGRPQRGTWRLEQVVEIRPGQVVLVELSEETGLSLR